MRIKGKITQDEFAWYVNNFSPLFLKEIWQGQKMRTFIVILTFKRLKLSSRPQLRRSEEVKFISDGGFSVCRPKVHRNCNLMTVTHAETFL